MHFNDSLCFMSCTARHGQLEHMRENMRTTMMNMPELSTGGVSTSSCWMLVRRSRDATCCNRFCETVTHRAAVNEVTLKAQKCFCIPE